VGRIVKPHGLRGEVVIELWTNRTERLEAGAVLTAEGRRLVVAEARPLKQRWLVALEGVSNLDEAEVLRDTVLKAPPAPGADELWVHELIGAEVVTPDGRVLGRVESVEANPASDLLVLAEGGLVPLRFVVGSVPGVQVTVDVPEGLL
jgi:16S rRNA processing protein RimM